MWSILVDFLKDFSNKNKKLAVEANQIHTKLHTFMERQSWRLQVYDHIHDLWLESQSKLMVKGDYTLPSDYMELQKKALLHDEMIIRVYLEIKHNDFKEQYQSEILDIYQYENWAIHLSKEELDLCKWIHKFMKDLEEMFVPCHELFLKSFEEDFPDKSTTVSELFSYLSIIKSGQNKSIQLFYLDKAEQIKNLLEKIDNKAKESPQLLEVYNYTKNDMMEHLKGVNEKRTNKN